jgi:hypothetical protein
MNAEIVKPISRREIPDDYESPEFFNEPEEIPSSGLLSGSGASTFMSI